MEKTPNRTRYKRMFTATFLISAFTVWMYYKSAGSGYNSSYVFITVTERHNLTKSDFLVFSRKCRIPSLDPFNEEARPFFRPERYTSCNKYPLLTFLSKNDNKVTLHVDGELISSYASHSIDCCYSTVTRKVTTSDPDNGIDISECASFKGNVTISKPTVLVKCKDAVTKKQVYTNTHTSVTITRRVQAKIDKMKNDSRVLSVLIVGIDSISRLNMIRTLPKTYQYLKGNDWIELKGYNKMGDNTFPNLMAVFTGKNESFAYDVCNPKEVGKLDRCNFIFFNYSEAGYITAYAEDEAKINTFNYKKKGFVNPPTDYYFRPYSMASEHLPMVKKDGMNYCVGPETYGEKIMNVAKDFAATFREFPTFGFFWMNSFSHNELNSPSGMDYKVRGFLRDIASEGVLNNSLVIFLSDHGLRFGEIRYTRTGWLEERLPFIFFSLPKWFQDSHPDDVANLRSNANKLTTPYDLHMTLQDVLVRFGKGGAAAPSSGCPSCKSLFSEVEEDRSCEDAGIAQHWCTCTGYRKVSTSEEFVVKAARSIIGKIEEIKGKHRSQTKRCAKYTLRNVISADISDSINWYKNNTYLLVVLETSPKAVFEGTAEMLLNNETYKFVVQNDVSRLDYYSDHSHCVHDAYLKTLCHCS